MSAETNTAKNKEIVRQFFEEVINNERWDLVEEMFASRFVLQAPFFEEPIEGAPDDVKNIVEKICFAFSDIQINVDKDLIAENGFVVARWTGTGRHEGEIEGRNRKGEIDVIEPTGAEVEAHGMTSFHFSADNKIDKASAVMVEMRAWEEHLEESLRRMDPESAGRKGCHPWRHVFGLTEEETS